ncbi:AAA family ATPase [Streptomyces sp. NPDC052092]|uniref:AAA family ATPase n=1 Tax=Streptomyces sp. NPDC052092 TaxID=3365685 RepID=UPI0037D65DD3
MEIERGKGWTSITKIEVELLFGLYSYEIPWNSDSLDPKLFILYGDNGSGKTTILHTLHHLISGATDRAHKSTVSRVPFRSFTISFSNGTTLQAQRDGRSVQGTFTLNLLHNGMKVAERTFKVTKPGFVPVPKTEDGVKLDKVFANTCAEFIGMESYLLTDDRQFDSDSVASKIENKTDVLDLSGVHGDETPFDFPADAPNGRRMAPRIGFDPGPADALILNAIERFDDWARERVVEGVSASSGNVNAVYSHLLDRLAVPQSVNQHTTKQRIERMERRIRFLAGVSERQAQYGFDAQFPGTDFLAQLGRVQKSSQELAAVALEPYLDSVEAKLRTQENTVSAIALFIDTLNEYLHNKYLSFNVGSGLRVHTSTGHVMPAQKLSSGERQLLTLFCNIMAARTKSSIFVIDEPEISLNIKWQRRLVDSLLGCTAKSGVQLAMASHSFELLSKHRDNVTRLLITEEGSH